MQGGAGRQHRRAFAAQETGTDEIPNGSLDGIAAVLIDLPDYLTDGELGGVLVEDETENSSLNLSVVMLGGRVIASAI